jgi:hypothetical protein
VDTATCAPELIEALRWADSSYDPQRRALRVPLTAPKYHTRLRGDIFVHHVRDSADYALALLDSREPARMERAVEMLWRLVDEQDDDPRSPTYGIWPWFYDEPLDQMATPDWNWADFIGVRLVQVLVRHPAALDDVAPDLARAVRSALGHAARSIMRRDVALSYTNIAIMGTYVTIMTGDLLGDAHIAGYGRDRLRRLAAFTAEYGGFPEYNSPNYTCVAVTELTRMLRDFRAEDDRALVRELHDRAWREIATHWHRPSAQWAGPHSRSYATLIGDGAGEVLDVVQRGLGERATVTRRRLPASLTLWALPLRCPDNVVGHFTDDEPARDVVADVSDAGGPAQALTRMRPGYALGVVSRGTFWEQARPLVAYASGDAGPVAWRPRLLFDGRDLACGRLATAVAGDVVLAGVWLADDVGAAHPDLDHELTGRVRASEIRLRFELLGAGPDVSLPGRAELGETVQVRFGSSATLTLRVFAAAFGGHSPRIEPGSRAGRDLDVVLYSGDERMFNLDDHLEAYVLFAVSLAEPPDQPADLSRLRLRRDEGSATVALESEGGEACVVVPRRPRPSGSHAGPGGS